MARAGTAKKPTATISESDRGGALRRASAELIDADAKLEEARAPVKRAKGTVKATGIPFDLFNVCHKIRHLEDESQRVSRVRQLHVCMDALLGDVVTPDLFQGEARPALSPETIEALRGASDEIAEHGDEELPFDADAGARPAAENTDTNEADWEEAPREEGDVPEDAGVAFNSGRTAGRRGDDAAACPFLADSPSGSLWRRGHEKGAAERDAAAARFSIVERVDHGLCLRDAASGDDVLTLGFGAGDEADALAQALNASNAAADMTDAEIVAGIRDIMINADDVSWVWCGHWQGLADGIRAEGGDDERAVATGERRLTASGVDVSDIKLPIVRFGRVSKKAAVECERVGRAYHAAGAGIDEFPHNWPSSAKDAFRRGWSAAAAEADDGPSIDDAPLPVPPATMTSDPALPRLIVRAGDRGPVVFDTLADRPLMDCGDEDAGRDWIETLEARHGDGLAGAPSITLREELVALAKAGSSRPRPSVPPSAGMSDTLAAAV